MNCGVATRSHVISPAMRSLRWMPLTYLAGLHGFLLFAPYVLLVLTVRHLYRRAQARRVAVAVAP